MLLEKYRPASTKEFTGNPLALQEIRKWLLLWQKGRALIVHGPTGTGKTLAVRLIAKEMNYEIIESNANEERRDIEKIISASLQYSFSKKKKLILIDDMEQMESGKALSELIEKSLYPVVMIVENLYERNMANFRKRFDSVKLLRIRYDSISKTLRHVCESEGIKYEQRSIDQLSKTANGDIRAALMDMEQMRAVEMKNVISTGYRDSTNDIFNTVKMIFKSSSMDAASAALQKCDNPDSITGWIEENIAQEYDAKGIARAMDFVSKADVMNSRIIKRQSWALKKYSYIFSFYGTAMSKDMPNNSFIRYNFPRFFPERSDEAQKKFSAAMHTSGKKLDLHFLREISKSRKVRNELGLTKDDMRGL